MAPSDYLDEDWPELCARLGRDWLTERTGLCPDEGGFADLTELAEWLTPGHDRRRGDAIFGALLRLGALDGGDDPDARAVVAHLLQPAARRIVASLRDLSADIDVIVAGALWEQIATYRWRTLRSSHSLNLARRTRATVVTQLAPDRDGAGVRRLVLGDPAEVKALRAAKPAESAAVDSERELAQLLGWARRSGVLSEADVQLLVEFELTAPEGQAPASAHRALLARRYGVSVRSLRKRTTRTRERLCQALDSYLADQAA